jgi:uncharacterized DUF497 family protein
MRFRFDEHKSARLRANPKRGIGLEEAQEVFSHPYYLVTLWKATKQEQKLYEEHS